MDLIVAALLMGAAVGALSSIIGSGGSVLTVPILIYFMGMEVHDALATSLIIVTLTSLIAAVSHYRLRHVNLRVGLPFAAAGVPGAVAGSWFSGSVDKDILLSLYALLLLPVAAWIIVGERGVVKRNGKRLTPNLNGLRGNLKVGVAGCLAGALTGFFGVGGGFLKVPLLMFVGGLTIHRAVGTSLFVIFVTAGTSILIHLQFSAPDWGIVALFVSGGVAGVLLGSSFMVKIKGAVLQTGFGCALIVVSLLMILVL